MNKTEDKKFTKGMLLNVINAFIEDNLGISIQKEIQKENTMINEIVEGTYSNGLEQLLIEKGIPIELAGKVTEAIPGLKESVNYIVGFFIDSFESVHDSIGDIAYQQHADKIGRAENDLISFQKRVNMGDIEGIRRLRDSVERDITDLVSDMDVRVKKCNEVPENGKKMLFGWLKVKEIKRTLSELEETLPVYVNTIVLLYGMELYLGETKNAKLTLSTAFEYIQRLFPYERPKDNRMYTLTDQEKWIQKPKEYCELIHNNKIKIEEFCTKSNSLIKSRKG